MINSTWIKVNRNHIHLCVGGTNEYLERLPVESHNEGATLYLPVTDLNTLIKNSGYPAPQMVVVEPLAKDCPPYHQLGDKTKVTSGKIAQLAKQYNLEEAVIRAVLEVESNGDGFLGDGRPKILFEAHWFGKFTNDRFNQSHPDISCHTWAEARKHYKGDSAEWDRLDKAINLNPEAAYKSASWGLAQIMGFNYAECGFKNVFDFVKAMHTSADAQLDAMFAFLKTSRLIDYLRKRDWSNFAYFYNGSGYVTNQYDLKLEKAYQKWK